jgi:Fe-S-cluster-containing dehydrogenase component
MEHAVPVGINWTQVESVGPTGTFPDGLKQYYVPRSCMHCDNPACVTVCPTGASAQREDGIVLVDHNICIGCAYCVEGCPYNARSIDARIEKAVKCTLCTNLIDNGEKPNCVHHCIAYARFYGDLDDPENEITQYLEQADNEGRSFHFLEDQGTGPTVVYLEPKCGMLENETSGFWS